MIPKVAPMLTPSVSAGMQERSWNAVAMNESDARVHASEWNLRHQRCEQCLRQGARPVRLLTEVLVSTVHR